LDLCGVVSDQSVSNVTEQYHKVQEVTHLSGCTLYVKHVIHWKLTFGPFGSLKGATWTFDV